MAPRSTPTPQLLLIAETRPTVAAGLEIFLAGVPDTQPVAVTIGFDHAVDFAQHHQIGLIIVGEGLGGATPLSELRRWRCKNSSWRLVLLVDVADRDTIIAALSEGASGIVPSSLDEQELQSAISGILAGCVYMPSTTATAHQQRPERPTNGAALCARPTLTPRQFEVLGVLSQGYSNKQIAQILSISESTVSMHLNAAFRALDVHDRTSAAMAYRTLARPTDEPRFEWSASRRSHAGRQLLKQF